MWQAKQSGGIEVGEIMFDDWTKDATCIYRPSLRKPATRFAIDAVDRFVSHNGNRWLVISVSGKRERRMLLFHRWSVVIQLLRAAQTWRKLPGEQDIPLANYPELA